MNDEIKSLRTQLEALQQQFSRNNFTSYQEFPKSCAFTNTLRVPVYSTAPSVCEVGEIISVGGKLEICSAANTWTVVRTQS